MVQERGGCWAVAAALVAALVALTGCTHHRSATGPSASPSPTATIVPTATAVGTPTSVASVAPPVPARSATPSPKTGPSTERPGPGTPPAAPTSPPVSTAAPSGVAFVITQADTGKTFTLPSGSVAELRLVGSFRWSAPQATPAIVALAPEALPTGAGYEAWRITATGHGTAVIESTGSPICPPGHVCAQYVVLFRVTLVVP
ncbi:MAG TPA: hypothetical protein VG779_02740 [Actinomycetota bacterium]|nr:hypothetical protein [Actinomycetota bacterium]